MRIDGFDELIADLGKELVGHDRYTAVSDASAQVSRVQAFDERVVAGASLDDLDLDLTPSVLRDYCEKLGRAPVTRDTLRALMPEQGLLVSGPDNEQVTAGALILFGKRLKDFFSHAVMSVTEAGKKREIYEAV